MRTRCTDRSRRLLTLILMLWGLGLMIPSALAQPVTPEYALERLFTSTAVEAAWFTPEFLAHPVLGPLGGIDEGIATLQREHGAFRSVRRLDDHWMVELDRARVPVRLVLDDEGRFARLLFEPPIARVDGLETIINDFAALPGQVGVLVLDNATERVALDPDRPLSVGSAYKLLLLQLLARDIAAGRRAWSDSVDMAADWRSPGALCPMGILSQWPTGEPLTLSTLAILMIAFNDHTAADALLAVLGRDTVEAAAPPRNRPFVSTREVTLLQSSDQSERLVRYRRGSQAERRAILTELASLPLPPCPSVPVAAASEMGWWFTARELCALISSVESLPAMRVDPGPAGDLGWATVAFTGGAMPGVVNLTAHLANPDGRSVCVATTWNHEAGMDERRFVTLWRGLLAALR